jgi:hypothetical protein
MLDARDAARYDPTFARTDSSHNFMPIEPSGQTLTEIPMTLRFITSRRQFMLVAITAAFLAACDSKKPEPQTTATPAAATDVVAKLAKADAVDGKVDKIVTKCGGCDLGMDGKSEIVLNVRDYKMQFCNPGCKERFEKIPTPRSWR